mmetsp:Transcript_15011/g.37803  ORF Transcript_15011/g.37803 Transcript_15011/m.37803 type:complete len:356 (-) Transcript_15011:947-2014(-)|eukprot:CAMPEP_0116110838 /NCGR_PEP_ID=MMETSP0327-20121206/18138_1 /TAXON_ID=44447 /ORGANISM="Pseudo-nitzschia delicatissima, Strain B596" /LENGTH=355 /DNA_ID=CAMNT_0003604055 /DNA_START=29 /DNA_END=1096 /DNA_ORIENTATION=-
MGKIRKAADTSKDEKPRKKFKKTSPHKKKTQKDGSEAKSDSSPAGEKWSKSKKKRMRKIMAKLKLEKSGKGTTKQATEEATSLATTNPDANTPAPNNGKKKNSIQEAFKARLAGSRFRILNEELYTTTSSTSYDKFKANPELFEQYHEGFRHQVESWPENPVDVIVRSLTSKFKQSVKKSEKCVVADFGCGDAQLAKDLLNVKRKKNQNVFDVHSFDLVAPNDLVTACDMADVPLENKSVDVCVFCLALMGTNLADFIREAHRVLKDDGIVKIAEVRSRIEYSHNRKNKNGNKESTEKTEGTLEEFTDVLTKLGFQCIQTDRSNTMFLMLDLKKNGKKPDKKLEFSAKPCIYKRR